MNKPFTVEMKTATQSKLAHVFAEGNRGANVPKKLIEDMYAIINEEWLGCLATEAETAVVVALCDATIDQGITEAVLNPNDLSTVIIATKAASFMEDEIAAHGDDRNRLNGLYREAFESLTRRGLIKHAEHDSGLRCALNLYWNPHAPTSE